jgi:hypothetical protein
MRKTMSLLTVLCALGSVSLTVFVPPASAAGLSPAVEDCNAHGSLTRHYTIAELRTAIATIPVDVKEYTNCGDVLQQALLAKIHSLHPDGNGSGGGSFLPTWLIVVLALLVVGGAGFGVYAWRQRASGTPDD